VRYNDLVGKINEDINSNVAKQIKLEVDSGKLP
jgi:hypothetical protein